MGDTARSGSRLWQLDNVRASGIALVGLGQLTVDREHLLITSARYCVIISRSFQIAELFEDYRNLLLPLGIGLVQLDESAAEDKASLVRDSVMDLAPGVEVIDVQSHCMMARNGRARTTAPHLYSLRKARFLGPV